MTDFSGLLPEIASCPIAAAIRSGEIAHSHPCSKIVSLQTGQFFQVPEPWSGRIDTAPILFISSNPSIDSLEEYPNEFWDADRVADFFLNRFTSSAGWVKDGLYALRLDGSRSKYVRFWASARARTCEILMKDKAAIVPGIDFALTEVVHCKSRGEEGVVDALRFCSKRYLERILSITAAKLLVVHGKKAEAEVRECLASVIEPQLEKQNLVKVDNREKLIAFLPHPNERGSNKSLIENMGSDGLEFIRAFVAAK
jgi:hypothetical protein